MEDWWEPKPQTDKEKALVKKQKAATAAAGDDKGKEEAATNEKNE